CSCNASVKNVLIFSKKGRLAIIEELFTSNLGGRGQRGAFPMLVTQIRPKSSAISLSRGKFQK
ncbi:hypothetical protein, partial [Paenibacillus macerans]|uniref:hypothetical protein n=1 Tax=Paenibacillus macerans TaxID=44252 RepID=UPI003D2DCD51